MIESVRSTLGLCLLALLVALAGVHVSHLWFELPARLPAWMLSTTRSPVFAGPTARTSMAPDVVLIRTRVNGDSWDGRSELPRLVVPQPGEEFAGEIVLHAEMLDASDGGRR